MSASWRTPISSMPASSSAPALRRSAADRCTTRRRRRRRHPRKRRPPTGLLGGEVKGGDCGPAAQPAWPGAAPAGKQQGQSHAAIFAARGGDRRSAHSVLPLQHLLCGSLQPRDDDGRAQCARRPLQPQGPAHRRGGRRRRRHAFQGFQPHARSGARHAPQGLDARHHHHAGVRHEPAGRRSAAPPRSPRARSRAPSRSARTRRRMRPSSCRRSWRSA